MTARCVAADLGPTLQSSSMASNFDSIGSAPELFVDKRRIARMDGVELRLHRPRPAEVAVRFDRPWEGPVSAYVTVFRDGDRFRMYYRGWADAEGRDYTCYAESPDGVTWSKPDLGLVEYRGSKANNIMWAGIGVHNFTPVLDANPQVRPKSATKPSAAESRTSSPYTPSLRPTASIGSPFPTSRSFPTASSTPRTSPSGIPGSSATACTSARPTKACAASASPSPTTSAIGTSRA
ncbi:MAG: hypothetical protein R2724_25650 [Bryobacterales bacterium]